MPHLTDDLLNTVDQPLQVAKDAKGNSYLLCDYNRDGDSYRCLATSRAAGGGAGEAGVCAVPADGGSGTRHSGGS